MSPVAEFFLAISPFVSAEVRKSLETLAKIMTMFPGQSLADVEKSIRNVIAAANSSADALVQRAKAFVSSAEPTESLDVLLKDLSKRNLAELRSIAAGLPLPVKGLKPAVLGEIRQWLESKGTYTPKSDNDRAKDRVAELVGDLPQRMGQMTPELAAEINRRAETASKDKTLGLPGFQMFAAAFLGSAIKESKPKLLQRIKAFVDRLVVSNAQTNSF